MQVQKTVFISYRRTNIYMARAVYANLRANGYDAFLDYQSLDSGDFSQSLLNQIAARAHFVVILTPSALERCSNPDDWMRKEIEYAIQQKRNVIPLMFEGFKFEEVKHYLLSDWLKMLPSYNGLRIPDDFFEEAMVRLCGNRYLDRDIDTVLHPVAAQAAKAAEAAQVKADAAPAPTPEQLEAERLFESGFKKLRFESNYVSAIEDLTNAIKLNPDYFEAYHRRGTAYINYGDKSAGLQDWRYAVSIRPNEERSSVLLSAIALYEGDIVTAIQEAEKAIIVNPNYDEAYFWRGYAFQRSNEYDKAIADYDKAISLNPQFTTAYFNRGNAFKQIKAYDKAIADYETLLRINPNDQLAKERLEKTQQMKGKNE